MAADGADEPQASELDQLEAQLFDTQKAIARLRSELAEAEDAQRRVGAIAGAALYAYGGRLGVLIGLVLGVLSVLVPELRR